MAFVFWDWKPLSRWRYEKAVANELSPEPPEVLTEVLVESDQDANLPKSGNIPIADRLIQPEIELHRFENSAPEITKPELPDRTPDKLESLTTTVDDVTQFQQQQLAELAVPTDAGEKGPKQVAAVKILLLNSRPRSNRAADVFKPEMQAAHSRSPDVRTISHGWPIPATTDGS